MHGAAEGEEGSVEVQDLEEFFLETGLMGCGIIPSHKGISKFNLYLPALILLQRQLGAAEGAVGFIDDRLINVLTECTRCEGTAPVIVVRCAEDKVILPPILSRSQCGVSAGSVGTAFYLHPWTRLFHSRDEIVDIDYCLRSDLPPVRVLQIMIVPLHQRRQDDIGSRVDGETETGLVPVPGVGKAAIVGVAEGAAEGVAVEV